MNSDREVKHIRELKLDNRDSEKNIKFIIPKLPKLKNINMGLMQSNSDGNLPANQNKGLHILTPVKKRIETAEPQACRVPKISNRNLPDVFTTPSNMTRKLKNIVDTSKSFIRNSSPSDFESAHNNSHDSKVQDPYSFFLPISRPKAEIKNRFISPVANSNPFNKISSNEITDSNNKSKHILTPGSKRALADFSGLQQSRTNDERSTEDSTNKSLYQLYFNKAFKPRSRENDLHANMAKIFKMKQILKKSPDSKVLINMSHQEVGVRIVKKNKLIPQMQLNEMITLKKIRSTPHNGIIKRMLHIPSFKIYDLITESITDISSDEKSDMKEQMQFWKSVDPNSSNLLKLNAFFWNSPEGCLTVAQNVAKYGYLSDYLENFGNFPENAIKSISKMILNGLKEFQDKTGKNYGAVNASNIVVDSNKQIKLCFHFQDYVRKHTDSFTNRSGKADGFSKLIEDLDNVNPFAKDIFDFGVLLLNLAFGDLKCLDASGVLGNEFQRSLGENSTKSGSDCCLLHAHKHESNFIQQGTHVLKSKVRKNNFNLSSYKMEISPRDSKKGDEKPNLFTMLSKCNRFSEEFIDFICCCLRYDQNQRASVSDLLVHDFLNDKHHSLGPLLTFDEIISMSLQKFDSEDALSNGYANIMTNKFCDMLLMSFLDAGVKSKFDLLMKNDPIKKSSDPRILSISETLDVSSEILWERLCKVIYS